MRKRVALVSGVVVAALVAAVLGATIALRLIGAGAFGPGGRPLSETDVRHSLDAERRSAEATPGPAVSPSGQSPSSGASGGSGHSPSAAARLGVFSSAGGTVFASCTPSGQATLSRWIPADGYSADGNGPGPASAVWVKFKSGSSELTVTVNCVGGRPHLVTSADDHGGGAGGGGGHGGGGHDGGRGGDGGGSGGGSDGGSSGGSSGGGRS